MKYIYGLEVNLEYEDGTQFDDLASLDDGCGNGLSVRSSSLEIVEKLLKENNHTINNIYYVDESFSKIESDWIDLEFENNGDELKTYLCIETDEENFDVNVLDLLKFTDIVNLDAEVDDLESDDGYAKTTVEGTMYISHFIKKL